MKKLLMGAFAFALALGMTAAAQDMSSASTGSTKADKKVTKAEKKEATTAAKGKAIRLSGWVKDGGSTFTNDKDKQDWKVSNAEVLKDHAGHHSKLKATLTETDHTLNVETGSVRMMSKRKQAGVKS